VDHRTSGGNAETARLPGRTTPSDGLGSGHLEVRHDEQEADVGVGVPASQGEFVQRSLDRAAPARPGTEWADAVESWHSASTIVRFGSVLGFTLAITAAVIGAVPVSSGLAIAALMPAVLVDLRHCRLPDVWLGSAAIVLLVGVGASWSSGSTTPSLAGMSAGAASMAIPILVLHLVSPRSMGFGDVKLALVLGAAVGVLDWRLAIPALASAAGATATVGVVTRARYIAFGPGLVAGTLATMLASDLMVPR
jgi:leader peptidase (prepilin peptidase)/N-methyltransferase